MSSKATQAMARNVQTLLSILKIGRPEFGEMLGWPRGRVTTFLQGKYDARLSTVCEVAEAFNERMGETDILSPENLISEKFAVPTEFFKQLA